MFRKETQKGITLISLVITIILLLILALVAINIAVDSEGLFAKANKAKEETRAGAVEESASMWHAENLMARYTKEAERSLDDILQELEEKDLLTSDEVAQVKSIGQVTIGSKTIVFKELEETPASEFETMELEDGTIAILKYTGTSKNIVFPRKIDGKIVTGIGTKQDTWDEVVPYGHGLLSIYIPDTVKIIGDCAFSGSFAENSNAIIYFPDSVEYIGEWSFECNGIKEVHLPDSVLEIGGSAFDDNNIEEVHIPNKLKTITWDVFRGNELKQVIIPDSVTCIETDAFGDNKITNLEIPSSVQEIGYCAFSNNCLPEDKAYIYNRNADGTEDKTSLNSYAGCAKETIIPNNVKTIGRQAFSHCIIEKVTIPNGVENIEESAFEWCSKIDNVTIPNSVTNVGSNVFMRCESLSNITISNSLTSIGGMFNGCISLNNVTIPNSVTSLRQTFQGCTSLNSITIPDSVKSIDYRAFMSCTSLSSIIIPSSVTSIGMYAFDGCTSLSSITLPSSITSISTSRTFNNLANPSTIYVPNETVKSLLIDGKNYQSSRTTIVVQ